MLGKLNHIAIAAKDASAHVKTFRDVFGMRISTRLPQPEHGVYTTFVDFGNTKLEFLEPLGGSSPISRFIEKNPKGGIHHICFEVKDLQSAIENLSRMGIAPLHPPKIGAHGNPVIFLHPGDCNGILTELEEIKR